MCLTCFVFYVFFFCFYFFFVFIFFFWPHIPRGSAYRLRFKARKNTCHAQNWDQIQKKSPNFYPHNQATQTNTKNFGINSFAFLVRFHISKFHFQLMDPAKSQKQVHNTLYHNSCIPKQPNLAFCTTCCTHLFVQP